MGACDFLEVRRICSRADSSGFWLTNTWWVKIAISIYGNREKWQWCYPLISSCHSFLWYSFLKQHIAARRGGSSLDTEQTLKTDMFYVLISTTTLTGTVFISFQIVFGCFAVIRPLYWNPWLLCSVFHIDFLDFKMKGHWFIKQLAINKWNG